MVAAAFGSAALCGGTVGIAGGLSVGALAAVLGAALGGGGGWLWERKREARARARLREEPHRGARARPRAARRGDERGGPGELTGTVLGGKYRIGKKIGSGGIGVVYAAEHTTLGHEVAVKVLRGAAARDGGEIARLRREAYIQVNIDQPQRRAACTTSIRCPTARCTSSWSASTAARSPTSSRASTSSRRASRSPSSSASAARSPPRTRRASSTATSSRATSSSATTARRRSSTSA